MTSASHFILYVADQNRSTAFYTAVLRMEPRLHTPGMTEFALPGGGVLGLMPEFGIRALLGPALPDPSQAQGIPRAELYLVVPEADRYHARAIAAGATELSPMQARSWGDVAAYSLDPDGHVLAFAAASSSAPIEDVQPTEVDTVRGVSLRSAHRAHYHEVNMDPSVELVLADYERRAADEARVMRADPADFERRVDDFLICVGPEAGRMLHLLATGANAQTILELGTSYGYSTLWLADAARATGGKVHSLELSQPKIDYAREQLARAGLADFVEFHVGSALDTLPRLPGPFDFVLVDLWKDVYGACFELFQPKLAPGALVAADNMLSPPSALAHARAYQALVRTKPDMDSVLLPVGNGLELSRKHGGQAEP